MPKALNIVRGLTLAGLVTTSLIIFCLSLTLIIISNNTSNAIHDLRFSMNVHNKTYSPETSKAMIACGVIGLIASCLGFVNFIHKHKKGPKVNESSAEAEKKHTKTGQKIDFLAILFAFFATLVSLIVAVFVVLATKAVISSPSLASLATVSVEAYACAAARIPSQLSLGLKSACNQAVHARRMAIAMCVLNFTQLGFLVALGMMKQSSKTEVERPIEV